jgi:outer membrane receptor protein involved in Fe transport
MKKSFWMLSAGLFALAQPAIAQETPQDDTGAGPEEQAAAANDESEPTTTDIIVTANRRASPLSDVPIAVSAVTAETLQNTGANDIRQLNQVAPSLLVSSTGSEANGSARIRGIGTVGDNPGLESSVAVFIDGVYRSRSGIGLNELGEIERVEVLRGPQGTLFGRNASAGLIHIISKQPSFNTQATAELTYGNYDFLRASGSITGPIVETLAYRLDGVYVQRDGFYRDINNGTRVNDRDRYFLRGQLRFEPNDLLSFRLIADYTKRDEKCCGAVYVNRDINPLIGNLNEPATPIAVGGAINPNGNNIINVLTALGQTPAAFTDAFSRRIYVTPGRSYAGETEDKGISGEVNWEFGGTTLTSITGYREYDSDQGSDTDYSTVDILYRAPDGGASRRFRTFSQELRLQGTIFGDRLDWLVGGYYADEDLTVTDNLRFGNQYGRFATCRIVSGGGLAALYSPASPGCLAARPALFGPASPLIFAGFDRLDSINNRGSTRDRYFQNSRNYAFFTHNIFHITDQIDLTLGARYTNERKRFDATFGNDNTACVAQQASLGPLLGNAALAPLAGALIGLACQGNSTAELNGVSINDRRSEDEFTGTGVLSYKPNDDVLVYASYSRGYKAGGFNLDRSALKSPIVSFASVGGAQALVKNLQFDQEINDAYELGFKYSSRTVQPQHRRLPPGVRELPAQHLQRHGLPGSEHQRLRPRSRHHRQRSEPGDRRLRRGQGQARRPLAGHRGGKLLPPDALSRHQCRLHLCRHQVSRQSGRQRSGRAARSRAAPPAGSQPVQRARDHGHGLGHLDAAARRLGPVGSALCRFPPHRRFQHRLRPVPAEDAGQLHPGQRAHRRSWAG